MILGPHATFFTYGHPLIETVERVVPGVEAYGQLGRKWFRLKKMAGTSRYSAVNWRLVVAFHSVWRLAQVVAEVGLQGQWSYSPECYEVAPVYTATHREWLFEYGERLLDAAVAAGEITEHFRAIAAPYQVRAAAWGVTRPIVSLSWRVGSGKTGGALAIMAARAERRILVLCPAGARKEWRTGGDRKFRKPSSVERFSGFETFRLMPESERRAGDEDLSTYLARMRAADRKEILVAGIESMGTHEETIAAWGPEAVYMDEYHRLGDRDRWKVLTDAAGNKFFEEVVTPTGASTRAVVAMRLLRLPTVRFRCGLSGTPLDDGRPRRLYAPLDLLSPGGFGVYSDFRERYCGLVKTEAGFLDDSGSSHMDELKARCAQFVYDVPRSESHEAMKNKLRIEVEYFKRSELCAPDAFTREIKALVKQARSSRQAQARLREARLAEAASMKRSLTREWSKEFLDSGAKVLVFLNRKAMADAWGEMLTKLGYPGWVAHGDMGAVECDRIVDRYSVHEGPCWLIGTWAAIGESKNGMQCSGLLIVAQLPEKPGVWQQGIGRVDRIDGVGTLVRVPIAEGTQDDQEVARLTRKFGAIEKFLEAPELRELGDKLDGTFEDDLDDLLDEMLAGMGVKVDKPDE